MVETAEIGAKKLTAQEIINTPVLFGESDVIKALQMQPGVSEGQEGMAGMHVHGGNADENLYMLDNVPLYQVNHFAGLSQHSMPKLSDISTFSSPQYLRNMTGGSPPILMSAPRTVHRKVITAHSDWV